ncbi:hypothetical protein LWI28_015123 [Acer negundo]|uniref:Class IV aminotransferase n=1 Tax=Acer negundo TaxID=4023 RepID=A0AAD5I9M2_ACENE|nr:hypothetical protein LWI28_015123 [Acer negundo]
MTSTSPRILSCNGVVSYSSETPSVSTFLQTHPGAYTTTRTHNNSSCPMFWERHLQRLANSARILFDSNSQLLFKSADVIPSLLTPKLSGIEDVSGSSIGGVFDVYAHFSGYTPLAFGVRGNGAHLAVVGRGRDVAEAKYSDWVRLCHKFFVVCRKDNSAADFEVQTAPISDGVLPGVIRQLVIEVCISKGIPLREVAPSWSEHELWEEAFITSSLRVLQHVESIQVPRTWELHGSKCWDEIAWKEKQFEESPGMITK